MGCWSWLWWTYWFDRQASGITDELRQAGVSLVEIDLNRTGSRVLSAPFELIPDECAEEGRYVDDIDYGKEPNPPLDCKDAEWADTLLRDQGLR